MKNTEFKNCHLYNKGYCECYLRKCISVSDCAQKIMAKRIIESLKE